MISPKFLAIRERFGAESLDVLRQALNVKDRMAGLIRKQRLLNYPDGTSLAGINTFHSKSNSSESAIIAMLYL
jgi:hypothetical protein